MSDALTLGRQARVRAWASEQAVLVSAYGAIGVFYVVSRLALLPRFPPFIDETTFATWLERGYWHPADRLISVSFGREPLFIWLGMMGMKLGFDPITSLRLVSFVAGLVTITFTALVAARLGGPRVAVTAAALYALLPFTFVYDVLGLMDPLVTALTAAALYLQLRLAREQRLDLALLLGMTFAAGVLTKATAEITILLAPVSLLLFPWSEPRRWQRLGRWVAAVALAVVMARFAYQILSLNPDYYRFAEIKRQVGQTNELHDVLHHPWTFVSRNTPDFLRAYAGYLTWPLIALLAFGAWVAVRAQRRLTIVLLVWAVAPLVAASLLALFAAPRYLLGSVPPILALLALGLVRLVELILARFPSARAHRASVAAAVFVAAAVAAVAFDLRVQLDPNRARYPAVDDVQFACGWPAGNGWVAFMDELRQLAPNGVNVAVASFRTFSDSVRLRMPASQGYQFVDAASPAGRVAPFLVESEDPPLDRGYGDLRPAWQYVRPRGGPPVTLYVRGFWTRAGFAADPDRLRDLLGLSPPEFDQWLARHPRQRAWRDAQPVAARVHAQEILPPVPPGTPPAPRCQL
jgi:hypothetical protein